MKISLQNKRALIGGSSKGLGFAVAEQLALSGAQVTIVSSNERLLKERVLALNKKTALKHNFLVCDYNDHESYAKKISEYFDITHNKWVNVGLGDALEKASTMCKKL